MAVSLSGMTLHTNNDNESGWGGTDGPDTYNNAVQGTNSESWQVSKNATETGTLTSSSALNTTRGIFSFWMSSNLSPYYTDIDLELQSTTNNYKNFTVANSTNKLIGGNFYPTVVDYVNKGTSTGTFAPASFSVLRIIVDNSSSGNIRSVINNWIDAMYYGPGHTIAGTTTGDELFAEAAAVDELSANKYGVMWNYNGIIYSQGDIDLSGTALTSDSETLVFIDTLNGYDTYNFDITGTVTFTGTSILAAGTIDYILDAESATAFSMTGGVLTGAQDIKLKDGQTFDNVVINSATASTIANDPDGCTWNTSGLITVATAGSLNNCILNEPSGTSAVSIATLDRIDGCTFVSDNTGHAVNLGTIGSTQSMNWDNTATGYASSNGSTGNEIILVSVSSGFTLTINVAAGATTPTYYNTGSGTVAIVSGSVSIDVNVKDQAGSNVTGAYVYIDEDLGAAGNITNTTTNASGDITTASYSGAASTATLRVRLYGYKAFLGSISLSGDSATNVILITDPQQN